MDSRDLYKQKLNAQLKEWNAQINLLAAKIENAGVDAKLRYKQELDGIRAKQAEAIKKIKELEDASSEAWDSVKMTTEKVLNDLKAGISQAVSKFKESNKG